MCLNMKVALIAYGNLNKNKFKKNNNFYFNNIKRRRALYYLPFKDALMKSRRSLICIFSLNRTFSVGQLPYFKSLVLSFFTILTWHFELYFQGNKGLSNILSFILAVVFDSLNELNADIPRLRIFCCILLPLCIK